jgi:hypothetical protein
MLPYFRSSFHGGGRGKGVISWKLEALSFERRRWLLIYDLGMKIYEGERGLPDGYGVEIFRLKISF